MRPASSHQPLYRPTLRTIAASALLATLASGCANLLGPGPADTERDAAQPAAAATPGQLPDLSAGEHLRSGIELLERGEAATARGHLQRAVAKRQSPTARMLLRDLDEDPVRRLGPTSFDYVVAPGDTLSLLAERYLDSKLRFYVLARYNGISNPSLVSVGQRLRIPARSGGAEPSTEVAAEATPVSDSAAATPAPTTVARAPAPDAASVDTGLARSVALLDEGRFEQAADAADRLGPGADASQARERVYLAWARSLQREGRLEEARDVLVRGSEAEPGSARIAEHREDIGTLLESDRLLRAGLAAEQGRTLENYERAYGLYNRGLDVSPRNLALTQRRERVRERLVDEWYRAGTERYRRRDIDGAIEAFDRVLQLEPGNERATAQRAVAVEAAARLADIRDG